MRVLYDYDHVISKFLSSLYAAREQTPRVRGLCLAKCLGIGNCSMRGKCGPAPTRKSQWGARVGRQDPRPRTGSPVGNQACIVHRLLWDLLSLKLPHPGLRQQMFTECLLNVYFNFLKSVLNLPSMECNQSNHFPPWAVTSFSLKELAVFCPLLTVKGNHLQWTCA